MRKIVFCAQASIGNGGWISHKIQESMKHIPFLEFFSRRENSRGGISRSRALNRTVWSPIESRNFCSFF